MCTKQQQLTTRSSIDGHFKLREYQQQQENKQQQHPQAIYVRSKLKRLARHS